jgi:four helix bundle protein
MHDFRYLDVWRLAVEVAVAVYEPTATFPHGERFVLVPQMRRSANSISSNIAEGSARATAPDFRRFLSIAKGSAAELESQLMLADRLGLLSSTEKLTVSQDIDRVRAMIEGLMRTL